MKQMKENLRYALRRRGWDLSRFPAANHVDGQVVEAIRAHDIDTVIDVGANRGQFSTGLRELGYTGRIISFEPDPQVAARLAERTADDSEWIVHNLGLGDRAASMTLHVSNGTDMSSLLDINDNFLSRDPERGRVVGATEVEVRTLDEMDIPGERLFIKTDTQGYDLRVLAGAARTLERTRGILTEMAVVPNYDGADNEWRAVLAFMAEHGFEPGGFFTIDRNASRQVCEMDGLFVRA